MILRGLLERARIETFEHGYAQCLRTRVGLLARVYELDNGGLYSVHGAVCSNAGRWFTSTWSDSGLWNAGILSDSGGVGDGWENGMDLIPVSHESAPERGLHRLGVVFVNVCDTCGLSVYHFADEVDEWCAHDHKRVACIRVLWQEGQFDDLERS